MQALPQTHSKSIMHFIQVHGIKTFKTINACIRCTHVFTQSCTVSSTGNNDQPINKYKRTQSTICVNNLSMHMPFVSHAHWHIHIHILATTCINTFDVYKHCSLTKYGQACTGSHLLRNVCCVVLRHQSTDQRANQEVMAFLFSANCETNNKHLAYICPGHRSLTNEFLS